MATREEEVEAFVARLERIWAPQVSHVALHPTRDGLLWVHGQILGGRGRFSFCRDVEGSCERVLLTRHNAQNAEDGRLDWNSPNRSLRFYSYFYNGDDEDEKEATFLAFATGWMFFFRRGCWLCGCLVEASAHEKAQWMHSFTREEIESWNLNF